MYKSQRGEIVTIIAIASVIILGVVTAISSTFIGKTNQSTKTFAAVNCDDEKWYCAGECASAGVRDIFNGTYPPDGSGNWRAEKATNCHLTSADQCSTTTSCSVPSPTPACSADEQNVNGQCDPACCKTDAQCTDNGANQKCTLPNGYCKSGTSCAAGTGEDPAQYIRKCASNKLCAWTTCSQKEIDDGLCSLDTANPKPASLVCKSDTECGYVAPTTIPTLTKAPTATPPTTCTQKSKCGGGCASGYYCNETYQCIKDSDCGAATPTPPKTCTKLNQCGGGCASGYYCNGTYQCIKDSDCGAEPTAPPGGGTSTCSAPGASCYNKPAQPETKLIGNVTHRRNCTFRKCSAGTNPTCTEVVDEAKDCTPWDPPINTGASCTVPGTQTTFKDKICATVKGISNAYTCKNGQIGNEQSCVLGCNFITNECKKPSDTGSTSSAAKHITVKGKITNKGAGGVNDLLVSIGVIAANGKPAVNLAPLSPFDTQLYGDGTYSFDFNVTNPESLPPTPSCILAVTTTSNVKVTDMNIPCPLNQTTQKDFEIAYPAVIDDCGPDRCPAPNEAIPLWSKCTNSANDGSCLRKSFFKSDSDCRGNSNELKPSGNNAPSELPYYCSSTQRTMTVNVKVEVHDKSKIADFNPQTKPWINFRENGTGILSNLAYAAVDNFTDSFEESFLVDVKDIQNAAGKTKAYFTEFCYWPVGVLSLQKCYNTVAAPIYPGGEKPTVNFKIVIE